MGGYGKCRCGNALRIEQSDGSLCDACYCKQYEVNSFVVTITLAQTYHNTTKEQLEKDLYKEENDTYVIQDFNVDIKQV